MAAIKLTLISSLIVVVINAVMGTLIAWVLVRDDFPGKRYVNSLIDLPFALPTIVAGLTLIALYGQNSPIGVSVAYTKAAVVLALLFVTLPFVVRAVQPVLIEVDREMEEAAASLGASRAQVFRSILLPDADPGDGGGARWRSRAPSGEFGSLVLITGNVPFDTQVALGLHLRPGGVGHIVGASAVAVVLLGISLLVLLLVFKLSSPAEAP